MSLDRIRVRRLRHAEDDRRGKFPLLNARGPLLSLAQVAELTGLTFEQVRYCEEQAFDKIRAALSAYGYHKEVR
jgi:DNA-directed RNA polymerase sigma subunit (sigma70/sigma32)